MSKATWRLKRMLARVLIHERDLEEVYTRLHEVKRRERLLAARKDALLRKESDLLSRIEEMKDG